MELTQEALDKLIDDRTKALLDIEKAKMAAEEESKRTVLRQEFKDIFENARKDAEAKGLKPEDPVKKLGRLVFSVGRAKGNAELALKYYDEDCKSLGFEDKAVVESVKKTLVAGVPGSGGLLIPNPIVEDVIQYLYANTMLDKMGVPRFTMPNGKYTRPRMSGAATASWVGETPVSDPSSQTFDDVNMTARKAMVYTPISNSLLRYSSVGLEALVARDLRKGMSILVDKAGFYGSGGEYQPLGIKNQKDIQTFGSSSTALTADTPIDLLLKLKSYNIPLGNVWMSISPQVESWFMKLKDSNLNYYFRDEMVRNKTIWGIKYIVSTNISYTDTTTDYGDIFIGDYDEFLFGVGRDLVIDVSNEASYVTTGGTTVSAWQKDLTLVRAITEVDFGLAHPKAFVYGQVSVA